MRLALLFTFLLGAVGTVNAQAPAGIYFKRTVVQTGVDARSSEVAAASVLVNPTDRAVLLRWTREVNDMPGEWSSRVCEGDACFGVGTDSEQFVVAANSERVLSPRVYPNGKTGEGLVTIRVEEVDDASRNAVASFSFEPIRSSPSRQSTTIYPNPGDREFRLSSEVPVSSITLTNMLGKVVRTYPAYLPTFDVRDLPNGIYLATLIGTDGRVVKTLRYSKRQVMP